VKHEVADAVSYLLKEKSVDKETFQEIMESVFLAMVKRKYGEVDNFSVIFNPDKGDIEIQCMKMVVADDEVTNPVAEIALTEAQLDDPEAQVGEETMVMVDYDREFGRRIVLAAKQMLIQRLREIEKETLFREFSQRIGEIVIGDIHQVNRNDIRLNIDKTEVVMPRNEMVHSERYRRGDHVKAIILDVRRTSRDPEIVVSRRSVDFVRRLFELEVPEIYDGIVEIKAIAREAGERTKIAVDTNDKRIDPVGACVGMKGVRIQAIVKELNHEKIDIILYERDRDKFIRRALAPVIPLELVYLEGGNKVLAVFSDEQIGQAFGRRGINIKLASHLTNYSIEPVRASDYYQEELSLDDVEGFPEGALELLRGGGYRTAEEVITAGRDALLKLESIDEGMADTILEVLGNYFEETEEA